ncbi:helix-turn-helix domain-containing protein [Variovorax paradoxus]|uniref:helix-turn-helix domain-containing protein n=1 Tax=Variovorax paradoxus TaxID=34073 RepID=UPI0038CFAE8A
MRQRIELTSVRRLRAAGSDALVGHSSSHSDGAGSRSAIGNPPGLLSARWDRQSGRNLLDLRTAACLSQKQLAGISGVSCAMISHLELGQIQPRPDVLERIACAIDLAVTVRFCSL